MRLWNSSTWQRTLDGSGWNFSLTPLYQRTRMLATACVCVCWSTANRASHQRSVCGQKLSSVCFSGHFHRGIRTANANSAHRNCWQKPACLADLLLESGYVWLMLKVAEVGSKLSNISTHPHAVPDENAAETFQPILTNIGKAMQAGHLRVSSVWWQWLLHGLC